VYYWDSYFTALGLVRDGQANLVGEMTDGFADLVRAHGFIPNGTRSYYLSRSQPPFFYLLAGLSTPEDPVAGQLRVLAALRTEHAFWMAGEKDVANGAAAQHVVRLADGSVLNRYWDRLDTPRDESWREDVALAQASERPPAELYRELRSAAESGWDFSSRWLADGRTLATIETTSIVPVDLNALLFGLESAIAEACDRAADAKCTREFRIRAQRRREAMDRVLWIAACGCYSDYQWRSKTPTRRLSAATLYPLFTGVASQDQGHRVADTVREELLAAGGVSTTTVNTGQQWDRPNGWAPLQWIAVAGLRAYGRQALAEDIGRRWIATVQASYDASGKLVEKYDAETRQPGGGGEYPLQDGFGWTNGVTRALLDLYPTAPPTR
jgi:alpha,alpha-trehalase